MPNWCENEIKIEGPTSTIHQLWLDARSYESKDNGQALLEAMEPIGEWDYDTAVNCWGCKWDVDIEGLENWDNSDGTATIEGLFQSAWSPPIEACDAFLENNPHCSIEMTYIETGVGYGGTYLNGDNESMDELYEESIKKPEDRSDLFNILDDRFDVTSMYLEEGI